MRKKALVVTMGLLFLGVAYSSLSRAASGGGVAILSFKTLFPLEAPYIGATNSIRGIPGAGAQWAITHGSGELHVDGRLKVRTKGLIVVKLGNNPITMFQAVVSLHEYWSGSYGYGRKCLDRPVSGRYEGRFTGEYTYRSTLTVHRTDYFRDDTGVDDRCSTLDCGNGKVVPEEINGDIYLRPPRKLAIGRRCPPNSAGAAAFSALRHRA